MDGKRPPSSPVLVCPGEITSITVANKNVRENVRCEYSSLVQALSVVILVADWCRQDVT